MTQFSIRESLVRETEVQLRIPGGERTVLWQASVVPRNPLCIERIVVPEQTPLRSLAGYAVRVPGRELARIQFEAFDLGLRTWIQVHTHPGEDVRMSGLDVQWAIADFPGALAIIVPDFCARGLTGWPGVAVYERSEAAWHRWPSASVPARITADAQ